MSLNLDRLEQPDSWKNFSEDWWIEQVGLVRSLFKRGKLDKRFLHRQVYEGGDWHYLFCKFGIIHRYYRHWKEDWKVASDLIDTTTLHDPKWGGLAEWKRMESLPVPDLPVSPTLIDKSRNLATNLAANDVNLSDLTSVVHWGGGIGLQTMMMRWWGAIHTEYILDLPAMSAVQYEYLRHNLDEPVHLALDRCIEGQINVVPLSRIELVPQNHDMFLALHSLNESSPYAQSYVVDTLDWFNADKLVLSWTPDHPMFSGSEKWMNLVRELEGSGRIVSLQAARGILRSDWDGDVQRLAAVYEKSYGVPVLYLGRDNWVNVVETGPNDRASLELQRFLQGVPVVVVDISHVPVRSAVDWVSEMAKKNDYYVDEQDEAIILIRNELIGPLIAQGHDLEPL